MMNRQIDPLVERVAWRFLQPQVHRDIFIVVSRDIDLANAAATVVADHTDQVERWVSENKMGKPTTEQIQNWNAVPEKLFQAVIAHPYVLIQEAYDH